MVVDCGGPLVDALVDALVDGWLRMVLPDSRAQATEAAALDTASGVKLRPCGSTSFVCKFVFLL